jgi:hypothetical protein
VYQPQPCRRWRAPGEQLGQGEAYLIAPRRYEEHEPPAGGEQPVGEGADGGGEVGGGEGVLGVRFELL